jgi:osmotically inducible lipoprotein OsmB
MTRQTIGVRGVSVALALVALSACAGMTAQEMSTAIGAGIGAVGGSVITGGSTIGTLGGAVVGGAIGHEIQKP